MTISSSYVRGYRAGSENRECLFSSVKQAKAQPGRYQNGKQTKAQKCFSERIALKATQQAQLQSTRLDKIRAKLQQKLLDKEKEKKPKMVSEVCFYGFRIV